MSSSLDLERWVAVVDDDESLRRSLARFSEPRHRRKDFDSAQEYLSSAPSTAPACIVLVVYLRDVMTGLELVVQRVGGDRTHVA